MADFSAQGASVLVVTQHRLAGTALASALTHSGVGRVTWCDSRAPLTAPVVVVLSLHDPAESVPRLLAGYQALGARTVFVYDGARPTEQLLWVAEQFGAWSTYNARDDFRVLTDQVLAARAGRVWEQDRSAERWSRSLNRGAQSLSRRELEVANAYCGTDLLKPEQVAQLLGLSVNTVRTHLANIRRKIPDQYTGNRNALRAALRSRGLID